MEFTRGNSGISERLRPRKGWDTSTLVPTGLTPVLPRWNQVILVTLDKRMCSEGTDTLTEPIQSVGPRPERDEYFIL